MENLYKLTLKEASDKLKKGDITSLDLTTSVLNRIEEVEPKVEAFITVTKELAIKQAKESDRRRAEGKTLSPIDGIPIAVKDLYCTKGVRTTAASKILDDFIPQYESTATKKLLDAGAVLVGDVDGNVPEEVAFQLETLEASFIENGASEFRIAQNDAEAKELWYARKNASQSITIFGNKKLNEDISVPRSMLPEALAAIYKLGEKYGFKVPCFGHAGDGNIHVNVMIDISQLDEGHKCIEEIFQLVVDMGGTLSGEHGIGTSKAPFMGIAFNEQEIQLFKDIKKAFDPNHILNPGKMGL